MRTAASVAAALSWLFIACASQTQPLHPETLRIASCQILVDGDPDAALERIDAALSMAAADGAQIACFPEACLLGWVNPEAHERAGTLDGPTVERLRGLSRQHGIMMAVGLAERSAAGLHNSAVLIDRDGALLLVHRKVNIMRGLMEPEYEPGPGAAASVVETRYGRIGLLICADTFEAPLVDEIARSRPDLVLVPYGWAAPEGDWPHHGQSLHAWIANTARKTGAPVLGVDSVGSLGHGPWAGFVLGGQSALAGPDGELEGVLADRAVEVRVFEFDVLE
ncbi:Aliphatic nitrilase [Planctomycetes bacterium Poly30]|uniref:Aliphatic nitrilase n=1 Tax=Saltatorellus ferox TaxID=2528018 RepID=A0A518ELZ7_9BACT|nr:Aliphatic nitrilase [Planctomycetes bacterium Poly30]